MLKWNEASGEPHSSSSRCGAAHSRRRSPLPWLVTGPTLSSCRAFTQAPLLCPPTCMHLHLICALAKLLQLLSRFVEQLVKKIAE